MKAETEIIIIIVRRGVYTHQDQSVERSLVAREAQLRQSWHQPRIAESLPVDQTADPPVKVAVAQQLAACVCIQQ